ncbi:DUF6934 family protein [Larkinella sp. VNQ87]|uniref:DUF6934 family protein n=1 Tax=Larkinella sp. VNQ87 TaxID=3400921 RepID=UPI003C128501
MQLPQYDFQASTDSLNFQFESVSATRTIRKFIEYSQIDEKSQLYNLALIDKNEHGRFSDDNDDCCTCKSATGMKTVEKRARLKVQEKHYKTAQEVFDAKHEAMKSLLKNVDLDQLKKQ